METVKRTFRISKEADEKVKKVKNKTGQNQDTIINKAIMKLRI
jgi:predicted DNA-binding protein